MSVCPVMTRCLFAARLREMIEKTRLSQERFASRAGLSHRQLTNLLSCACQPTLATIRLIVTALSIALDRQGKDVQAELLRE